MKYRPLFDKIIVEPIQNEEVTKSGLLLTSANKETPQTGKVVAVGPGGTPDGKELKMVVSVGDVVVYGKYNGTSIKYDGKDMLVLSLADVLCVAE